MSATFPIDDAISQRDSRQVETAFPRRPLRWLSRRHNLFDSQMVIRDALSATLRQHLDLFRNIDGIAGPHGVPQSQP